MRAASRDHEQAVDAALKATLALLAADGQPVTDATKQAISTTLRSLPGDEPPGRLTRPLEPRGFDMRGGVERAGAGKVRAAAPAPKAAVAVLPARKRDAKDAKEEAAEKAAARERAAAARSAR